jgi:hypothetical protein
MGFNPAKHTADWLPFKKHPQAVDPDYLVSWNNKQAPEWVTADDKYDQMVDSTSGPSTGRSRGTALCGTGKLSPTPAERREGSRECAGGVT